MFADKPAATPEQLTKAAALRVSADRSNRSAEESFQRSDTDGFLSQWASNIGADKDRRNADILENGGCAQFPVLCDAEGNVVANRVYLFANQHAPWQGPNRRWRLSDELAAKLGRKWIPVTGYRGKSRIQTTLSLHEESRWFPAYAKLTVPAGSKSTGLGGCANAYVGVFRADTDSQE